LDDYVVTRVVTAAAVTAAAAAAAAAAAPSAIEDPPALGKGAADGGGGGSASDDRALVSSKEGDGSVASGKRSSHSNHTRSAGHDNAAAAASRSRGLSLGDEAEGIDDDEVSEYLQSLHGAGGAGGVGQNQVVHPREGLNPFTTTLIVINYMSVGYLLVPGGACQEGNARPNASRQILTILHPSSLCHRRHFAHQHIAGLGFVSELHDVDLCAGGVRKGRVARAVSRSGRRR
jgi:hypothetical protein